MILLRNKEEFAVLTFAGLAGTALKELAAPSERSYSISRLRNYDFIRCTLDPKDAARLPYMRTTEDVFWIIGSRPLSSRQDLAGLSTLVSHANILKGLERKNRLFRPKRPRLPSFNCFVKQDHDRVIRRKDIAERVNRAVASVFPNWLHSDPATVELWAFYIAEQLHLGLRLSDERMKYRAQKPVLRPGTLRPTIAAALMRSVNPQQGELILDPMCGTGTILSEGLDLGTGAIFAGGDSDGIAVEMAARRLAKQGVSIRQWDATNLPSELRLADCIVCNLPFGKQYSTREQNRSLYPALIGHWIRRLKTTGRLVLLTADSNTLERVLRQNRLNWRTEWKARVLGLWATAYKVVLSSNEIADR